MSRAALTLALVCFACKESPKTEPREVPKAPKIEVPKIDVAAAMKAATPVPTGVFDFEVVAKGSGYVLRDEWIEITFPAKPDVSRGSEPMADGTAFEFLTAQALVANTHYGLGVSPFRADKPVDAKRGVEGTRDAALRAVKAKVISETAIELAGLPATRIVATANEAGATVYIDLRIVWDPKHRQILTLSVTSEARDAGPMAPAFFDSLVVRPALGSPHDPPHEIGKAMPVAGVELVRNADGYELRGKTMEVQFPARPFVKPEGAGSQFEGFSASLHQNEKDQLGLIALSVAKGVTYDSVKGIAGMRDGMIGAVMPGVKPKVTKTKILGLDGQRVTASTPKMQLEAVLVWFPEERMAMAAIAVNDGEELGASGRAFLDSLAPRR